MIKIRELGDDVRVPKTPRQNRMQIFVFVFIPLVVLISGYAHPLQLWPLALALLAGTTVGGRMMTGIYERHSLNGAMHSSAWPWPPPRRPN